MYKDRSENKVTEKWRTYITGIMTKNFISLKKTDKYFRGHITESTSKAIEENWIRKLGIDNEIISLNICKNNEPLGIAIEGRNIYNGDCREMIHRHFLRAIMPHFCIGLTKRFLVGDELLEVNGLMIYGMRSKDVISALKKLPSNIQIVVSRSLRTSCDDISEHNDEDGTLKPIYFYDMDEDISSRTSTLKSNSSLFSTTSRDFGSAASVGGLIDGRYEQVGDYLRDISGWRGPIVIELRKHHKESLGLALEEIQDPITSDLIIVFKIILPDMKAAKDGRLHVGDRLLHVNGKSVVGISFRKVCQWMKSSSGGRLMLYICKPYFKTFNFEKEDETDKATENIHIDSDKLPKLCEETEEERIVIPPLPESLESHLIIKRTGANLGLYFDIIDDGKNGCRIKKMVNGLVKIDGTLHEGDHITKINDVCLKITDKSLLGNCLNRIAKSNSDYQISYLTKEDIDIHNSKYTGSVSSTKRIYPDTSFTESHEEYEARSNSIPYDQSQDSQFQIFEIIVENDGVTNLGLVLFPSLNEPKRFVGIMDIHHGSLADKCGLLKINDTILSVNGESLESFSPKDAAILLSSFLRNKETLQFKIKRFINYDEDQSHDKDIETNYAVLSHIPDIYFCTITKNNVGYGLTVKDLKSNLGIVVNEVEFESPADKAEIIKPGHRFVFANNEDVNMCSVDTILKIVKNTPHHLSIIMEKPKFREFNVLTVKDSSNSLGLNVAGGIDTKYPLPVIESILPKSTCSFSEQLYADDYLCEVNELSMVNRSHDDIIQILRSLHGEVNLKIRRKIPFGKRDTLLNIKSSTFLQDYIKSNQFSVTISKPISTIPSFGINFGDVVILDNNEVDVLFRYKVVLYIEKDSIFEKYVPEVTRDCFLVAINQSAIDVNISCEDLKAMIDSESHTELLFFRDIPYHCLETPFDSPHTGVDQDTQSIIDRDVKLNERKVLEDCTTKSPMEYSCDIDIINGTIEANSENTVVTNFSGNNIQDNDADFIDPNNEQLTESVPLKSDNTLFEESDSTDSHEEPLPVECNIHVKENVQESSFENQMDKPLSRRSSLENKDFVNDYLLGEVYKALEIETPCTQTSLIKVDKRDTGVDQVDVEVTDNAQIRKKEQKEEYESNDKIKEEVSSNKEEQNEQDEFHDEIKSKEEYESNELEKENEQYVSNDEIKLEEDKMKKDESKPNDNEEEEIKIVEEEIENKEDESYLEVKQNEDLESNEKEKEKKDVEPTSNCRENGKSPEQIYTNVFKSIDDDDKLCDSPSKSDFGIAIDNIVVPKIENSELGFNIFGGIRSGPAGESLPIYVVSVERNSRNWPQGQKEPFLSNGLQLLELNGSDLSVLDITAIERMIATTEGDLLFKVLKLK